MIKIAAIRQGNKVYIGEGHYNILQRRDENCDLIIKNIDEIEYGFLTDNNEFVSREVAAKIAFECGQIKEKKCSLQSKDIMTGE